MNTQEHIESILNEIEAMEVELNEQADRISDLKAFWQGQLATVHPTYTDTPMAEEYYGG